MSGVESEFSSQNWNARTSRHLKDVQALGEARFKQVFDMASNGSRFVRGRIVRANPEPTDLDDSDVTLQSEDNNEGVEDSELETIGNKIMQGHEDGKSVQIC